MMGLSCKKDTAYLKHDLYESKATELMTQIFYYDNDSLCSYIVEPEPNSSLLKTIEEEMPDLNYRERLMEILGTENESSLDSLIALSSNFEFKPSMFKEASKIISLDEFKSITKTMDSIVKNGSQETIDSYFGNCPGGTYFVSKPIFNKDFSIAVISINMAYVCIWRFPRVYHFIDNQWVDDYSLRN